MYLLAIKYVIPLSTLNPKNKIKIFTLATKKLNLPLSSTPINLPKSIINVNDNIADKALNKILCNNSFFKNLNLYF